MDGFRVSAKIPFVDLGFQGLILQEPSSSCCFKGPNNQQVEVEADC